MSHSSEGLWACSVGREARTPTTFQVAAAVAPLGRGMEIASRTRAVSATARDSPSTLGPARHPPDPRLAMGRRVVIQMPLSVFH
jgi:hypothetical protein